MELKDVAGYEGLYAVSDDGRVWSSRAERWLRPHVNHSGYLKVGLNRDGRTLNRFVHRLVCAAFHGEPPDESYQVDHINADHRDNRAENLRWVTGDENHHHAVERGLASERRPIVAFNRAGDVLRFHSIASAVRSGFTQARECLACDDMTSNDYAFVFESEWPDTDRDAYFDRLDKMRAGIIPGAPKRKRKGKIAVRGTSILNGSVIEFSSCNAAAKAGFEGVWQCLNGRQKTCKGRIWEEIE